MRRAIRITSRQHPFVQRCRVLASRRRDEPAVLLDGEHLVTEALDAGLAIEGILTDGTSRAIVARARAAGAAIYEGSDAVLAAASPMRTTSGLVAIASWTPATVEAALSGAPALAIGLVDVQDPGNMGSVVRSAHALGATGVVAIDRTADPGGWKALRGAMGSTFRIPTARGGLSDVLREAQSQGLRVAATVTEDGDALHEADLRSPALILLGNEGAGLPAAVLDRVDVRLTIPMRPGVNSLNVAVTAGIILYEARRQR